jgi:flagellar assembly factor FliW
MSVSTQASLSLDLQSVPPEDVITFQNGLVGLPEWKRFVLLTLDEAEAGVGLLQSLDSQQFSLLVTNPRQFLPDYSVQLSECEREQLGLEAGVEPIIFTTLSLHGQVVTINLVGPLIVNPETRGATQLVLTESNYSARHPVVQLDRAED